MVVLSIVSPALRTRTLLTPATEAAVLPQALSRHYSSARSDALLRQAFLA